MASVPSERINSSSRSRTQTKKPSDSISEIERSVPRPARSNARQKRSASASSHRPANVVTAGVERKASWTKSPTDAAPPIDTTDVPSACRSRPRRIANVSRAALSLSPSTKITAFTPATIPKPEARSPKCEGADRHSGLSALLAAEGYLPQPSYGDQTCGYVLDTVPHEPVEEPVPAWDKAGETGVMGIK